MDVNSILDLARDQTGTNSTQITNTMAIKYLNRIYRELVSEVSESNTYYFWQEFYTDLVSWQSIYSIPTNADKIFNVYIQYDSTQSFIKAQSSAYINQNDDPEKLKTSISQWQCIYIIENTTFSIYPAPIAWITNWLKIQATIIPSDLTVWGTESDIKFKPRYHDILWIWMKQYIYGNRQLLDKRNDAIWEYERAKAKFLQNILPRDLSFEQWVMPDLDFLT